ncbi:hypothetical protein MB46_05515 [Arthrobacter alpinus]|uniref:GNAT family N-acetyltransferase n=1 Tax=Arthrobacter alpinus TaxID=656366 RepID=UPI0005C99625|nr:GNAT family N-acetyltransferase [Arthrobacter alpinus]ALV45044.1 hypothetical protein MB46_05515 [Arthrobacter alpinus]
MADPGPGERVAVRPAVVDDVPHILDINALAGRSGGTAESMHRAIEDEGRLVLVATSGDAVIAWAKTHYWDHTDRLAPAGQYLGGITVDPLWRRQRVAMELTQARLDWIRKRSSCAWYVVNAANQASILLHHQWGFTEVTRAADFHGTTFAGGCGILMRAEFKK